MTRRRTFTAERDENWWMQHKGRRDANHAAVRDGIRKGGYLVFDTAGVGGGHPDLEVHLGGSRIAYVEIKEPGKETELSEQEVKWHQRARAAGIDVSVQIDVAGALEWLSRLGGKGIVPVRQSIERSGPPRKPAAQAEWIGDSLKRLREQNNMQSLDQRIRARATPNHRSHR